MAWFDGYRFAPPILRTAEFAPCVIVMMIVRSTPKRRHAVIADLKGDADELAKLFAELDERERERLLVLLFGSEFSL